MAINVNNLTTVSQRQREIMGRLVRRNTILDLLTPHTGFNRGEATWRFYEAGGDLQDCCTTEDGEGEFSEKNINIACIKKRNTFCGEDLQEKLNDFVFRVTAGGESIDRALTDVFTEQELAFLSRQIDNLVFKGDTTSSDPNLNKIDGFIKLASADGTVVTPSGTNLLQVINELVAALPADAYDMGRIGVFIPVEYSQILQGSLVAQNLYHYNPGNRTIYDEFEIPGIAGITIIPTRGLSGTGRILVAPIANMHWFTNLQNDKMTLKWGFNEYHDNWYYYVKFLLGIAFAFDEYVVISSVLTDDIVNAPICINVCGIPGEDATGASSQLAENVNALVSAMSSFVQVQSATAKASGSEFMSLDQIAAQLESKGFPVPAALKKAIADNAAEKSEVTSETE